MSSKCPTCTPSKDDEGAHPFWDRLGIGLSLACLIHCLTLPIVASGLAIWAAVDLHLWLALLIVPIAGVVAWNAHRTHRHRWVGPLLLVGSACIVGAILLDPFVSAWTETAVTAIGSVLVVAGHWIHYRASQSVRRTMAVGSDA